MTLDELTTPATREEVEEAIYATLAARGIDTTTWKAGAVVRAIVTAVAIVLSALSRLQAQIARGGFLELAERDWLTLVALHVYGVERIMGTFATSTVTLDNEGGGVFSGDPGDLVFSAEGKLYRNTQPFAVAALESGVTISVQAVELGSASNAGNGAIDTLETTLLGVVIVGSTPAVGTDEETDAALRTRCRAKTGTLSPNGPRDAYDFVARSAKRPNGTTIGVTRVLTVADGIGGIDVYLADASGEVAGDAGDPVTDLGRVAELIHTQAEPLAITPRVQSATPLVVPITYTYWVRDSSGLTDQQIREQVADRLLAWLAGQPIGGERIPPSTTGYVFHDALEAVIGSTLPNHLIDVVVSSPSDDLEVTIPEAPVLGAITATVVQVARGLT